MFPWRGCLRFRTNPGQSKIYEGEIVGDCIPDITTGDILIDAKSVDQIGETERAQMLNYLRIARKPVGLVINFKNPRLEWERLVR